MIYSRSRSYYVKVLVFLGRILWSIMIVAGLYPTCGGANAETLRFSSTYAEEALSDEDVPAVVPSHPRLFIREEPWNHGPGLATLKVWAKEEPLKSYLKRKPWNPKPGLEWAFRYLITGDEKTVPPIIERMKDDSVSYWPGRLAGLATLYDWLHHSPTFTAPDKKQVEDKIIRWAQEAIKMGQRRSDMWSHRAYGPPIDIAAAGLALYGHRKEADRFIAMAGGYMKKNMFRGWALNDGAWQGGWCYYGASSSLFKFIALWSSATSDDLFQYIEPRQGDWVKNHLYYLIYTMYPDHTPVDTCGFSYCPWQHGGNARLLLLTRAYHDPEGLRELIWRNPWGWRLGIDQFLYYFPEIEKIKTGHHTLPLTKCWGRKGVGYVQMRSGWGDDDTIIEFKCGDYFWSHQFQNQNSFTIYKKGKLAIQSGVYDSYWGNHMQFYYRPTISSNSMLIIQPGEVSWIPPSVANRYNIPNKNGYFSEWGGQRTCYMMPKYGSAETCFTFKKYLYRKNHQHHFETGEIKAFEVTDRYSYIFGNATMAYNNPVFTYPGNKPKLDLFTRELVFLDNKYLVVFDRVNSLNAKYEKRWLLHSIGEPKFLDKPVKVEYPFHREIHKGGLVQINNQGGTLYCQTLFPEDYLIRKVGGSATVTEARADPSNRGNATLKTQVHGKYKRVSFTIASDYAQKEDWTVEFIDSDHFKIKGSATGKDGIGSYSSPKHGVFVSNSQSILIPKGNWKGTPQKGDRFYFSVTSSSFRFWVNGKNYYPSPKFLVHIIKDGSHIDPGNWRIEVFPKRKQKFDTFLHLLYPCDRDKTVPPQAEGVTTLNNHMKGIIIDNWIVLFGHKGTICQKVEYLVNNKGKTANLLLDMKSKTPYMINIIKGTSESNKQRITASREGTLFFETTEPCRLEITSL